MTRLENRLLESLRTATAGRKTTFQARAARLPVLGGEIVEALRGSGDDVLYTPGAGGCVEQIAPFLSDELSASERRASAHQRLVAISTVYRSMLVGLL